jgi:hypothetical protein
VDGEYLLASRPIKRPTFSPRAAPKRTVRGSSLPVICIWFDLAPERLTSVSFTRPASEPRSPEWSCEEIVCFSGTFAETSARTGPQKKRAGKFFTGDLFAFGEFDFLEVHKARGRAEVA